MSEQINNLNFKKSNSDGTTTDIQNSVIKQARFISDYADDSDLNGIFLIAPNGTSDYVYRKQFNIRFNIIFQII